MGQYLAIGIYTKIRASKNEAASRYNSIDECKEAIIKEFTLNDEVYDFKEDENSIEFSIKPQVMERDLAKLMQQFYALRYSTIEKYDSREALKAVMACKDKNDILQLLNEKTFQCFQKGYPYYISVKATKGWTRSMEVSVSSIILSIDGKIIMECYNDLFHFFTRLIRERLSNIPLSNALNVYIDG